MFQVTPQNIPKKQLKPYLWGAIRKNITSDRFSTKTAISAHIQLSLRRDNYLCTHVAISVSI